MHKSRAGRKNHEIRADAKYITRKELVTNARVIVEDKLRTICRLDPISHLPTAAMVTGMVINRHSMTVITSTTAPHVHCEY